jgi:hypothetical protein
MIQKPGRLIMRNTACKLILVLILVGCKHPSEQAYRDKVLNNYFSITDSSAKFDTSDINFRILKAYHQNDTTALKELDNYIHQQKNARPNWDLWNSDIPLSPLKKLNADVAFRFIFSVADAPAYEVITLTMKDTAYKLHYLYYFHDRQAASFEKRKEFDKKINEKDWQEIAGKLLEADFWGLKSEGNGRGFDGNDLTVIGYQKWDNMERHHFVHRWMRTGLNDAFYYIYYKLLDKNERVFATEQ